MTPRLFAIILLAGALSGCKSAEGLYLPGCAAYAGDRIELQDGRFVWDKYTDQVRLDAAGERIDPFPGFPRSGTYAINGDVLTLEVADPRSRETFFLHYDDGRLILLTETQQAEFESGGRYDECVLTRTTEE